jgi:FdhD protein
MAARARPGKAGRLRVTAVDGHDFQSRREVLATEEPLEVRIAGPGQSAESVFVTMRTPGSDWELAAGFLFTEGLVSGAEEIDVIRYCGDDTPEEQRYNVATVHLRRPFDPATLRRNFYATSSCGVCGKASIDQIEVLCRTIGPGLTVEREVVASLPGTLRDAQEIFDETGGLHAAGLFTAAGELVGIYEDVGRHNALDKLVGSELLARRLPASERVVLVSGRASFELVQKTAMAGVPVMCAVSAPSTLAVATANRLGVTLVGFLRGSKFNIYSHPERILL